FVSLCRSKYRHWLRSAHVYLACALFFLVIGADLVWNLTTPAAEAHVTYSGAYLGQATYSAHLQRIGGIGFSPYPSVFYARSVVMALHRFITGRELTDVTAEYH